MKATILLALALGACSTGADTHSDKVRTTSTYGNPFHIETEQVWFWEAPYIHPECRAHEAELWAMPIETKRVPMLALQLLYAVTYRAPVPPRMAEFYAAPKNGSPAMVYVNEYYQGWLARDYDLHGRCHAWFDQTTGNPEFHR